MGRYLGDEGEAFFDGICANREITANISTKDRNGWDYYLEFPQEKSEQTLDSSPPPISCKVQVKSSELSHDKLQVAVSVLYKLAKEPLPTFFCFLKYKDSHIPQKAYLLHIDFSLIDKILKRVRTLELKGKRDLLHKSKMTIHYGDEHSFPIGIDEKSTIKELIESYVPNGLEDYILAKQKHLNTSGFGENSHEMKVTFFSNDGDVDEHLIDLELGLKESIPASSIDAHTTRYGVKLPDTELSTISDVTFSFQGLEPQEGFLFFKQSQYAPPLIFKANIYLPKFFFQYESSALIIRVKSDEIDLIIKRGIPSIKPYFILGEKLPIAELRKRVNLFHLLRIKGDLIVGFELNSIAIPLGTLQTSDVNDDIDSELLLKLVNAAFDVCQNLNIPEDRVVLDLNELQSHRETILSAHALLCVHHSHAKVSVSFLPSDVDDNSFPPGAFIFKVKTRIGNICLAVLGAVTHIGGVAEKDSKANNYYFNASDIRIAKHWIGSREELEKATFVEDEECFVKELESEGFEVAYLKG